MPAIGRGPKPKSLVEHLSEQAPVRAVNDIVNLERYLWSARLLLNQATEYRIAGEEEQLYVILLRFASLMVETLPRHRDWRATNPTYAGLKRELVERYLPELERLKASLRLKERPEPPAAHSRNRPADAVPLSASYLPQLDWAASGAPPPPPPGPGGQGGLRVDDLLEVVRGNGGGAAAPPPPPYGMPYQHPPHPQQQQQQQFGGPVDPYALAAAAAASAAAAPGGGGLDQLQQPRYSGSYAAASSSSSSSGRHALFGAPPPPPSSSSYGGRGGSGGSAEAAQWQAPGGPGGGGALPRYPMLEAGRQRSSSPPRGAAAAAELAGLALAPHPSAGPSLGPQEVAVFGMPASTHGLPDTCTAPHPPPPPSSSSPPASASPSAAPGGPKELAKRAQMRDVHVSVALMEEFLQYARANTGRGIESCGILAGKLIAGDSTFAITTLIIPKQQGTSDTVQALNEEEIFEAQFARELYPMGWIHTHPTQTCFLSSVDVHTQCGYQTMLDEAVAIVMAPTDRSKRCGIFRLTAPGGLGLVQKCPQRGFHTHPPTETGQELYELCGHVFLNPRTRHEVLDLR